VRCADSLTSRGLPVDRSRSGCGASVLSIFAGTKRARSSAGPDRLRFARLVRRTRHVGQLEETVKEAVAHHLLALEAHFAGDVGFYDLLTQYIAREGYPLFLHSREYF
jgi:hypothetical protein